MDLNLQCWRWLRDRILFLTGALTVLDLMRLAEDENCEWQSFLSKVYEWDHARRVEVGKWLLALSAILVASIFTMMGKVQPLPTYGISAVASGAGVFAASGMVTIWSARSISAHLARTMAVTARFVAIRTFLTRIRQDEGL